MANGKHECGGCNLIFGSLGAFDRHRVGSYGDPIYQYSSSGKPIRVIGYTPSTRHRLTLEEIQAIGMQQNAKGQWILAEIDMNAVFGKIDPEEVPMPDEDELEGSA